MGFYRSPLGIDPLRLDDAQLRVRHDVFTSNVIRERGLEAALVESCQAELQFVRPEAFRAVPSRMRSRAYRVVAPRKRRLHSSRAARDEPGEDVAHALRWRTG